MFKVWACFGEKIEKSAEGNVLHTSELNWNKKYWKRETESIQSQKDHETLWLGRLPNSTSFSKRVAEQP